MSSSTTNYNLIKPDYTESADISVINDNMDIIDSTMKTNATNISSLNSNKQNVNDNSLSTTNKTVSGAINELNSDKQDSLVGRTLSDIDLNTVVKAGHYWVSTTNVSHAPTNYYGYLEVIRSGDGAYMQRFTQFGNDTTSTRATIYIRFFINNQWYGWNKVAQLIT